MPALTETIAALLRDVALFSRHASGLTLRAYQQPVAQAIVDSIIHKRGDTIVVMFPRQSGKNELQAQIETYLLTLFQQLPAEMVKASPTYRPQTVNAMRRLERVLHRNLLTRDRWRRRYGYIFQMGTASMTFLSADPNASIVGATANVLLEIDEAQDISQAKYDKDLAPMVASTNATRAFFGTAWTDDTLLQRELADAKRQEQVDGRRRVFIVDAEDVAREVPAYGEFVAGQVRKLGRNHPLVRTQFYCETLAEHGGLFPPARRILMQGIHPRPTGPTTGHVYAFLIDVAGQDENAGGKPGDLANPRRDSTALTIVDIDLATVNDALIQAPIYRVAARISWTGQKHTTIFAQLLALAETWAPQWCAIDTTGIGAGLSSFLQRALIGTTVLPFTFTAPSKSQLGWDFIAIVETGRWRDYAPPDAEADQFWRQLAACHYETSGPNQQIRWSVPESARDPDTAELLHDDWIMSAALAAAIDVQDWGPTGPGLSHMIKAPDAIEEADRTGFR